MAGRRTRGKGRSGGGGFFGALVGLCLLGLVGVGLGWGYLYWSFSAPGPTAGREGPVVVVAEKGAPVMRIAAELEAAGVIRNAQIFARGARFVGLSGELKAGEYEIPAGASMADIWTLFESGKSRLFPITIPEGYTSAMAVQVLADSEILSGPVPPVPNEGTILPETYMVSRGASRADVLAQMIQAHDEAMAQLWPTRAPDLPFTSMAEAVTLASIVEKETGIAEERPRVAAVFVNRMRLGMRLQSDPTIIYGLCKCPKLLDAQGNPRGIRQSEIDARNSYNTYQIDGLPPTPIANPGKASIAAVLNPPKTDELFFVADGTGGHQFSKSYAEHNAAVARWREIERQRAAGGSAQGQ